MANVPLMFASMDTLNDAIHDLILAHLKRTSISGRRFGDKLLGDPGFVSSLKGGRKTSLKTADKVLDEIGEPLIGPAFLREVEAFLDAAGTKPYVFGEVAARDISFVDRLRDGVSFHLATVDKVRAWMAAHADEACLAAMRRAVADVPILARQYERQGKTGNDEDEGPHLSVREAAAWLGISARSVYRMRDEGRGPDHYIFGGRILYRMGALKRWAAERFVKIGPGGGEKAGSKRGKGRAKKAVDSVLCLAAVPAGLGLLGVDPAIAASGTAISAVLNVVTDTVARSGGHLATSLAAGTALACWILRPDAKQLFGTTVARIAASAERMAPRDLTIAFHEHTGVKGWLRADECYPASKIRSRTVARA